MTTLEELLRGVDASWRPLVDEARLDAVLERLGAAPTAPPAGLVFEALRSFRLDETRVVIIGQDPYPGAGEAQGLCFSVPRGFPLPDSLVRVFGCLDRAGLRRADRLAPTGDLRPWAAQGVLMLNTALTTAPGQRRAHAKEWKPFVDEFLRRLCADRRAAGRQLQFLLWGNDARAYAAAARAHGHVVREWTHPSPMADNRVDAAARFRECPHFEEVNAALAALGERPISWDNDAPVIVFTDGSCPLNGKPDARAGFAAVFGGGAFNGVVVRGEVRPSAYRLADEARPESGLAAAAVVAVDDTAAAAAVAPSNNRGELLGLVYAFLALLRGRAIGNIEVVSDSEISVNTLNKWLPARLAKGTERELKNFDLVWVAWRLLEALRTQARAVLITHTRGHQPKPPPDAPARDRIFHLGNERADLHAAAPLAGDPDHQYAVEVLNPIAALVGMQ